MELPKEVRTNPKLDGYGEPIIASLLTALPLRQRGLQWEPPKVVIELLCEKMLNHPTTCNAHPISATRRWVKQRGDILTNHRPAPNPSDDHAQNYNHNTKNQIN